MVYLQYIYIFIYVYIFTHTYSTQSDPNHFDWYRSKTDPAEGTLEQSVFRLKTLLEIRGGSTDPAYTLQMHQSKYGLGDRRTLDQAIAFSGIDTKNHRILGNRCGNIDYVPFKEHPFGVNYIPPFDPVNEAFIGTRDPGSIYYNESSLEMKRKWEDAIAERQRSDQRILLRNLKGASKTGVRTDVRTIRELAAARANMGGLNSVAHIVDVSFGDGYGLHSQNEPDGSLIMVFLVAFIGICINMFCCRRCYSGKTPHTADENNIFTKTV